MWLWKRITYWSSTGAPHWPRHVYCSSQICPFICFSKLYMFMWKGSLVMYSTLQFPHQTGIWEHETEYQNLKNDLLPQQFPSHPEKYFLLSYIKKPTQTRWPPQSRYLTDRYSRWISALWGKETSWPKSLLVFLSASSSRPLITDKINFVSEFPSQVTYIYLPSLHHLSNLVNTSISATKYFSREHDSIKA